jgi:predicted molibdopterin-dependent oxidoreductase YjgC
LSGKANAQRLYERPFSQTLCAVSLGPIGAGFKRPDLSEIVGLLDDGPIVMLYDDAFAGIVDKGDALLALSRFVEVLRTRGDVGVLPMLDDCNSMGARDLQVFPGRANSGAWSRSVLSDLLDADSQIRAAFVMGSNIAVGPDVEAVQTRLDRLDLLVVSELFMTETAKLAHVLLPAASFAEKMGSFTNAERRVQMVHVAVPAFGMARADWQMLVDLTIL